MGELIHKPGEKSTHFNCPRKKKKGGKGRELFLIVGRALRKMRPYYLPIGERKRTGTIHGMRVPFSTGMLKKNGKTTTKKAKSRSYYGANTAPLT